MDNRTNTPLATQPARRRLHPLIATAAGAVIVASLAATAAITGLFPKASSDSALNNQTQAAQVSPQGVVDTAQPANPANYAQQQAPQQQSAPQGQEQGQQQVQQQAPNAAAPAQPPAQQLTQPQYGQSGQPPQAAPQEQYAQQPPPAACQSCGTVEGISAVRHEGHGTGLGAVGGALAGGVVGNQFGSGNGRTAMTLLGAVGGGFAGNSVEKHLRSTTSYSVRVRMENGKTRYFTYHEAPPFRQGERVRVQNGTLVAG